MEIYTNMSTQAQTQAPRNPPFRAEHLGSLLRPEYLLEKRGEVDRGEATTADLKPLEDKAITEAVKLQHDLGFHAVSDGEYRRHSTSVLSRQRKEFMNER